jgi:hypothetical protein
MLREIGNVRQIPGESRRRCFSDEAMDLTVWIAENGEMAGFELCYDKGGNERSLRWKRDGGYAHKRVDDGERGRELKHKESPILIPDGMCECKKISLLFEKNSRDIDGSVVAFVSRKLAEYPL